MKIYTECSLENFVPWSGAVYTFNHIMEEGGMRNLEWVLENSYPDGIDETALNDIFWFEPEWCFEMAGVSNPYEEEEEDEEEDEDEKDE